MNEVHEKIRGQFACFIILPGQYFDSETNLHYNLARYYDSQLGRYITSDPAGLNGGLNTYLYANANANAITTTDPLGLCPCKGGDWDVVPKMGDWSFSLALGGYVSAGSATFKCKQDASLTCTASVFCIGGGPIIGGGVSWGLMGSAFASDSGGLGGWSGWQLTGGAGPISGSASGSGGSPISTSSSGQSGSVSAGPMIYGGAAGIKCYTAYLDCSCPCDGEE